VQQSATVEVAPDKLGLLWTAEWLLDLRAISTIRAHFQALLGDALRLPTLPGYLSGFVLALTFAPGIARLVVELLSEVFGSLPDASLLPLLPSLILQLRAYPHVLQPLIKEASAIFPATLAQFAAWQPAWMEAEAPQPVVPGAPDPAATPGELAVRRLLADAPATTNAIAAWLGLEASWRIEAEDSRHKPELSAEERAAQQLLHSAPTTCAAIHTLLQFALR